MPQIKIEGADDFQQEVVFAARAGGKIEDAVWEVVRATSLETLRRVKQRMPVDTGFARARWGSPDAPGGVWREDRQNLSIEQGADLAPYEYIIRLNEGSSQQAPAGFIDAAAMEASDDLTDGMLTAVVRVWNDDSA